MLLLILLTLITLCTVATPSIRLILENLLEIKRIKYWLLSLAFSQVAISFTLFLSHKFIMFIHNVFNWNNGSAKWKQNTLIQMPEKENLFQMFSTVIQAIDIVNWLEYEIALKHLDWCKSLETYNCHHVFRKKYSIEMKKWECWWHNLYWA